MRRIDWNWRLELVGSLGFDRTWLPSFVFTACSWVFNPLLAHFVVGVEGWGGGVGTLLKSH